MGSGFLMAKMRNLHIQARIMLFHRCFTIAQWFYISLCLHWHCFFILFLYNWTLRKNIWSWLIRVWIQRGVKFYSAFALHMFDGSHNNARVTYLIFYNSIFKYAICVISVNEKRRNKRVISSFIRFNMNRKGYIFSLFAYMQHAWFTHKFMHCQNDWEYLLPMCI